MTTIELMTLYEFNILPFEDKHRNITNIGFPLYTYVTKAEIYECYSFDDFFVEMVYDNKNAIIEFRSFDTGEMLYEFNGKIELH